MLFGHPSMIHDLITLVAPETAAVFYHHYLEKRRLHIKAADRERAKSLLPWAEINRLAAAQPPAADRVKVMRTSHVVATSLYRADDSSGSVRAGVFQDLLYQGSSLILNKVDASVPAIGRLAAALERELNGEVQVNAYLSFAAGGAFKPHYDWHDVIVLQVHGRKRWRSYGFTVQHPVKTTRVPPNTKTVVWEDLLEPGDVLYLPRGEVHEASVEGGNSVHLTISVRSCRGLDFLAAIIERARDEDLFRRDIPVAGSASARAEYEAAFKHAMHALIERADLNGYLEMENRTRRLVPLVNLALVPPFPPDTLVEPAGRRRAQFDVATEGLVEVSLGGETFRLSAPARRVLSSLLLGNELSVEALISKFADQFAEPAVHAAVAELAHQGLVGLRVPGASGD